MATENRGGIGFLGMLCILFIGLRLAGVIDWPWWAVLLPVWGPLAIVGATLAIWFVVETAREVRRQLGGDR